MSKSKAQGTAWESWLVKWLNKIPELAGSARRLPELGVYDDGDVWFEDRAGEGWYVECKATQALNVTRVLSKARLKSPNPKATVVFWKRLSKLKPDQKKRTPDGEPMVVVMALDTFHLLMRDR